MIEVQALSKTYGEIPAVQNLSFKVNKGEVVGFLGPNGAGKTTTMKIITGFMAPTSGEVKVAGFDVFENPLEVKSRIGYLPETPPVYGDMRVEDYLFFAARLKKVPRDKVAVHVREAVEQTNLGDVRRRMIQNLSKGFRQRVGLAQALVSKPEVLILDEPTVGLDPRQMAEIRELIRNLRGQHTIVLSTHILPEVEASCQRVIIINQGQIVAEDSIDGLLKSQSASRRITLKVKRPGAYLLQELKGLQGVLSVVAEANEGQYRLEVDNRDETVEQIAQKVVAGHMGLLQLHVQALGLEDVFIHLITSEQGGAK